MATLKSQKMVRGRDLKTPLAASAMDKKSNGKKGGPGDPPKKKVKNNKFPITKGKVNIYSTEGKKISTMTTAQLKQLQKSGKGFSGSAKQINEGNWMYKKPVGGDSSKKGKGKAKEIKKAAKKI